MLPIPENQNPVTSPTAEPAAFDRETINAKYLAERDRRLVEGRAEIRDLTETEALTHYRDDPFTPFRNRKPVNDEVDVVIVGGGIAGVLTGANLRKAGVERIRIIDQAGGIGGTWYWNRYPGVMCDIESHIYMPMLEEFGYVPTRRYAYGEEILGHLEVIAESFRLPADSLFHTGVTHAEWNETAGRWSIQTDRGDTIQSQWYVLAVGILNLMKLPAIPGMDDFAGASFHTARWNFDYTGGSAHEPLDKLGDKAVALLGTGASGIQCLPPLAASAKHVYVFQRTPSAVGERHNHPTARDFGRSLQSGWQRERMDNFQAIMMGISVECDLVDDGWTHHYAVVNNPPYKDGMTRVDLALSAERTDFEVMEKHRQRVDEFVHDPVKAAILKPYYRYICKRPCFHDEYLYAFNKPNVTLIDCPAGIDRITKDGLDVDGVHYEVDCIVYGTGFEAERTPLHRRAGHNVVGRNGISLAEKWSGGPRTLFGMLSRGFPNMFFMPAPAQQSVVTVNYTQLAVLGAEFVGRAIGLFKERAIAVFDVRAQAESAWVEGVAETSVDSSPVYSTCTPSRINNEGHPEDISPLNGNYGGRFGDWFGYRELLEGWLNAANFEDLEVEPRTSAP